MTQPSILSSADPNLRDRFVTISSVYRESLRGRGELVPSIRIRGKWLAEAGFNEGARVRVSVEDKRLVLAIEE